MAIPCPDTPRQLGDMIAEVFAEFMHEEGAAQRSNDFADKVMGLIGELSGESVCSRSRCLLDDQAWNRPMAAHPDGVLRYDPKSGSVIMPNHW